MTSAAENPVPTVDEAFGLVVHETLFRKRITQVKLAAALGITQAAVSKKLKGERPWTLKDQVAAADALREDLRDLLSVMWREDPTAVAHPQRRADDGWALRGSNPQPTDYKVEGSVTDLATWRRDKAVKVA